MKERKKFRGFTLIEMIVVLAIIGILTAILAPTMSAYYARSRVKTANEDARMIYNAAQTAIQTYRSIDRPQLDDWSSSAPANPNAKSCFSSNLDLIIEYNEDGNGSVAFGYVDPGTGAETWFDTPVDSAQWREIPDDPTAPVDVVNEIFRTVSDVEHVNYIIYVKNYVVEAVVAAESRSTDYIGYYTTGTVTTERADDDYENCRVHFLWEKAEAYKNYSVEPTT